MAYKQESCPLCGRDMTAIETHPGRGELYCGHCDLTIGGNDAKTPEKLIALMDGSEHRRLKAENAKLKQELEAVGTAAYLYGRNDLKAENAKLRELCAGLWNVMWACAEQRCPHRHEDCFVVNGNGDEPKGHGECWYKLRMRELGIGETG